MAKRGPSKLNLLLAVDKPVGCTSHDVVGRVRRAVGERRVGHAGTLDPLASGVMVIGIGQATRLLGMLTLDTKNYIADISFGSETNTDDAEGQVTRSVEPSPELSDELFARAELAKTVGPQAQVPPAFSAISVNGVRAYKSARAGEQVELPARDVEVYSAQLISISEGQNGPVWTVAYSVSKGTYIRALARDLGRAVGGAAHISQLRRTASGSISLADALAVDDITVESARVAQLDPVRVLGTNAVEVSDAAAADILCGRKLSPAAAPESVIGERLALINGGELRALARRDDTCIAMTDVFPQGITGVRS